MDPRPGRWTSLALPAVMALVPFEPRRPTLPLGPFHVTVLEGAALIALVAMFTFEGASHADGTRRRRPGLPALLLAAFAGVELLSAITSDDPAGSMKFALRMACMAAFAAGVARSDPGARGRALAGLALGGLVAAALATAEGVGWRALDPLLAAFREMPFNVAGVRRATAGSEYPNLGSTGIAYGLLAAVAWAGARRWGPLRTIPLALPYALGLLYTYSRGAVVALAVALTVAAAVLAAADGAQASAKGRAILAPAVALGVLAVVGGAFAFGGEVFQLRLASEGVGDWYGARYEPEAAALSLAPGGATTTAVRVTNTGRKAWTREGQFHLSYHWYDVERRLAMDGGRTALPRTLDSGQSVVLMPEVRAPRTSGEYLLLWDMVQEHTSWFSGQGVRPAVVRVTVGDPPPAVRAVSAPPLPAGLAWRPGRGELWTLAGRMWRAHPLLGVGPDRFRHLYGPWAGQTWWDDRVYANNLFLEVAATAGTIAAALLAATLIVGLGRAWGARTDEEALAEAAAAASLLAFVAVHGVVDYVLAFTGHYLVLGFAVGTASARGRRE